MKGLLFATLASACLVLAFAATPCQEHREKELKSNAKIKVVPKCDENGDYEAFQCFEGSPFCMCWRKDGSHIVEPSLNLKACKCLVHRDGVKRLIGNYRPQCEADGTYSRTQCHGGMGYCWCVDENGQKIDKSLNDC